MLLPIAAALFVGIYFSYEVGAATITTTTPGPVLYYTIGQPAAISCTAVLDADSNSPQAYDQATSLQLENSRFPGVYVQHGPVSQLVSGLQKNVSSTWAGYAIITASRPQPDTLQAGFLLPSIQDGNYSCAVLFYSSGDLKTSFQVFTTKPPDEFYISTRNLSKVMAVEINEGEMVRAACTAVNSRPGFSLTLATNMPSAITHISSTSVSNGNNYYNASTTVAVVGKTELNFKQMNCTGIPPANISSLQPVTVTAMIIVNYGPYDNISSFQMYRANSANVQCCLSSYPAIKSFGWTQDGVGIPCNTQACSVTIPQQQNLIQLKCVGTNQKTLRVGTCTVVITLIENATQGLPQAVQPGIPTAVASSAPKGISEFLSDALPPTVTETGLALAASASAGTVGFTIGIAVGCVILVVIIVAVVVAIVIIRRRRTNREPTAAEETAMHHLELRQRAAVERQHQQDRAISHGSVKSGNSHRKDSRAATTHRDQHHLGVSSSVSRSSNRSGSSYYDSRSSHRQ